LKDIMNEYDVPPAEHDDSQGDGVVRHPAPRGRRFRLLVIAAAVLFVVAVSLSLIAVGHVFGTSASASNPRPRVGSARSLIAAQAAPSSRPLTAAAIAARVDPGLVDINVVFGHPGARGAATGMVLTPAGVVLTNNHVIHGATRISVTDVGNGRTYSASVVGYDLTADVAVLQLQGASGLQTAPLGDSSAVATGAKVTALGNAGGVGGTPRVASGSVTAVGRTITASDGGYAQRLWGLIATSAAIRPGDSGGPLVTRTGQVIGMDAAGSAGFLQPLRTQGFAIPINAAVSIVNQVEAGTASSTVHIGPTGFLGVAVAPPAQAGPGVVIGTQSQGALVAGALAGYPAAHVGLKQGDVITSVDGRSVTSATGLTGLLSAHHPGDTVQLRWVGPSGQTHSATVKLASGPPA
jgi:S1-C subfamily serine protease